MSANPQMVVRIMANITELKRAMAESTSVVTTTTASMGRLSASLDGSRLFQQANNIAASINQIGGASKLSDVEAARMSATLDRAIDKARRMGTEIPTDILKTRDALVRTNAEMDKLPAKMSGMVSSLKSVAGAMGVAFSVGAVVGFGKEIFRMGDQIQVMADKTAMSGTEVQRLGFVADQAGVSMESIVGAVQNLQQRLGSGDTGAVGAIKALGTNTSDFLALGPYEQFLRLAEGIGSIQDPTRKAVLEAELFGRAWKDIGPAVTAQIRSIADGAPVMSDNTIQALDAAGDAWSKFTLQLKVWVAELYNVMGRAFDRLVANIYKGIAETIDGFAMLARLAEKVPFAERLGLKGMSGYFDEQARWYRDAAKGLTTYTDAGKKAAAVVTALASNTKTAAGAGSAHTTALRLSEVAVKSYADANKKLNEMIRDQIDLLPRVKQGVATMGVGTTGPLVAQMPTVGRSPLTSPWVEALNRDMESLNRTTDMGAVAARQFIASWERLKQVDADLEKASSKLRILVGDLKETGKRLGYDLADMLGANIASGNWSQFENQLSGALSKAMGSAAAAGLNMIVPGLGTMLQPILDALSSKLLGALGLGTKGRDLVKEFAGSVGGFDALRAQLATLPGEGEKLWIALTQGVGRNNPKQAQAAIDAVKAALANSPQALAGAAGYQTMAELEAVAKKARSTYDYLVESGKYSASQIAQAFKVYQDAAQAAMSDSARAAIAASGAMTAAIQKDLAALTSSRDSLVQSIANEAPEEVMGIIEAETRARIAQVEAEMQAKQSQLDAAAEAGQAAIDQVKDDAVEVNDYVRELFGKPMRIPIEWDYAGMQGGFFGGSGMPSQASSSASSQNITVQSYLDGQMVAESVVRTSKRLGLA